MSFDRQIIAIAKVERQTTIYSNDEDLRKLAEAVGIKVFGAADLEAPPKQ